MNHRIVLFIVFSIITTASFTPLVHAQVNTNVFYADYSVLPSPGASSAAGYATQVNLSTGTAQVSVPLCNLRGHSMQLPVSIGYQATGIKVQQLSGPVGLGWSLQSGGVITRVVRGKPDDDRSERSGNQSSGYQDSGYSGANGTYRGTGYWVDQFLDNNVNLPRMLEDGRWDSQPDIYYFSFLGRSGRFVLDKDGNPVLIPQQDIKINRLLPKKHDDFYKNENNQRYATWVITTPDGTSYLFGNHDPNTVVSGSRALPNGVELTQYTVTTPAVACFPAATKTQPSFASSWYLTSVVSPQGNTEFTFTYRAGSPITYKDQTNLRYDLLWKSLKDVPRCSPATNTIYTITNQTEIVNPLYITEIRSPHSNGSLRFSYQPAKLDAAVEGGEALQSIQVLDAREGVRNTIRFTYSGLSPDYRPGTRPPRNAASARLRLNTVQIGSQPPYEFTYNPLNLPLRNSTAVDYWGYYNGKIDQSRNNGAVPGTYFQAEYPPQISHFFPGANRSPDETSMQAGILTGMKLPGGGSVSYEYGMHWYWMVTPSGFSVSQPFGGLRIRQMTVSDGVDPGKDIVTRYAYTEENNPYRTSGTADATIASDLPYYRIIYLVQKKKPYDLIAHFLVRSSQPANLDPLVLGNGIVYNCVTVSQTGKGKTVYRFTGFDSHPDQAPREFPVVSSRIGTLQELYRRPHTPNSSRAWERGLLTDVKVYGEEGKLKSWKHSDYVFNAPTGKPTPVVRGIVFNQWERIVSEKDRITIPGGGADAFGVYKEESQWVYLERTTERLYDQQDDQQFAETVTDYSYNPFNLQIARTRVTDSEGRTIETHFKYPVDYPSVSPAVGRYQLGADLKAVVNEMVRRHMTGVPIETQVWQEAPSGALTLLSATLTQYKYVPKPAGYHFWQYTGDWDPHPSDPSVNSVKRTMIVPGEALQLHTEVGLGNYSESNLDAEGNLTYDRRFQSESVAKVYSEQGRLLEAEGRDGVPVTAVWNHAGSLPVASVANARYSQVAFADFEQGSDQGWTYNPAHKLPLLAANDPALAKTGYGVYQLNGETNNTVTRSGLDPSLTYVVSFWATGNNTTVSVNGSQLSIPDNTEWRYYRRQLSGSSSVEIKLLSGGATFMDDLWLHPVNAICTSFVTDPVTGTTARTGANGLTAYYNYDSMGRLAEVKDGQGNIVTSYQYRYKDQDAPRWIDTGETRCVTGTDGKPTGENEQRDRNANSPTYNQTRWVNIGTSGACPGRAPR